MPFLSDLVLDGGLSVLHDTADRLDICHTEPTSYAEATGSYSVGNKTGLSVGAPGARAPSGRKVTVAATTDGDVTATSAGSSDDAQYWAITDTGSGVLLAAGPLNAAQMVTDGNVFTLAAFDIYLTGPA